MRSFLRICLLLSPLPGALWSQQWEFGGSAGYGMYRDVSLTNGTITGKTGFKSGVAFGAVFGNQTTRLIGGEARYTFRSNDLTVKSGGTEAKAGAQSHALHYDLLIHSKSSEARVRPFAAIGGGIKYYRGTGAEPVFQPLSNLVVLTHTNELQPLISAGGGLKFRLSPRTLMRIDARDYITPFPGDLLARRANTRASGWFHDFVVMFGFSGVF
jgi:hypothetical protein